MVINGIINKVVSRAGNLSSTLLDLTEDSVDEYSLENRRTAHNKEGEKITGQLAIEDAEAYARGTRDGAPVPPEDETYHNNSKWYSEQSGESAEASAQQAAAASTSAANAEFQAKMAESYADGTSGLPERPTEATDNAHYYMDESKAASVASGSSMRIAGVFCEDSEAYARGTRNGVDVPISDETYQNNSRYYRDECRSIAGSLTSVLKPKGTCVFANLPTIASSQPGDMWNVEDEFITTSDFREGAGMVVPAGSDVYLTVDEKWDVLAGAPVTGVKGDAEPDYRRGNVNITPVDVGAASASMIANVEPGTLATHAYAIGEQFVLGGVLHIATAAIAIGDTLEVGTNCAINQSITDQIKSIVDAYVTGVKGDAETDYRTGDVNITPANIGAVAESTNPIREYYGTCSTAAATAAKVVSVSDTSFKMTVGARITVKFTETNTAQNPTINVNSKGAKSVFYNTAVITTSSLSMAGTASRYISFVYDGTYWVWNGWSIDSNTTYSDFTAATSSAAGAHGLVPAPAAGKQASFLRGDKTWAVPTNTWTKLAGATADAAGTAGYCPQPTAGQQNYFLRGNGAWTSPAGTRSVLGLGNTTGAVPIANGGTGSTSSNGGFLVVETKTISGLTIASGSTWGAKVALSKSGYYPLGIIGRDCYAGTGGSGAANAVLFQCILTDQANGSGNIAYGIRADGAVNNCVMNFKVLWVKV